jgi:hypothetical protein
MLARRSASSAGRRPSSHLEWGAADYRVSELMQD